tara:strand:+ start:4333 stop:4941 length:609 start_codon:yes stop_codon:yes gene_type:complete
MQKEREMFGLNGKANGTLVGALIACGIAGSAHGDIIQDEFDGRFMMGSNNPGQSFTAEGGEIEFISAHIHDGNAHFGIFEITINLYVGIFDTLIDTETVIMQDGHSDMWADFDFSGNILTQGDIYSFDVSSSSGRGMIGSHQHTWVGGYLGGEYVGGDFYSSPNAGSVVETHDLAFRVTQVPAPGAMGVLAGGLALAARRRR